MVPNSRRRLLDSYWSGPIESVGSRGLFGWSESLEGQKTFYGLVPDGSPDVTLTLLDGGTFLVAVFENVFIVSPPRPVRAVDFLDAAGERDSRRLA